MKDYYMVLEVHPTASPDVIKRAYLTLSMKYNPSTTAFSLDVAESMMQDLNEAYAVLSSPSRRQQYDVAYYRYFGEQSNQDASYKNTSNYQSGYNVRNDCENYSQPKKKKGNIRKIFTQKGLFSVDGRRNRLAFLVCNIFAGAVSGGLFAIALVVAESFRSWDLYVALILTIFVFVTYIFFTNCAKRCHDLNRDNTIAVVMMLLNGFGFLVNTFLISVPKWLGFLVIASTVIINLYLTFSKGTEGPNQYGEDPLANE